MGKIISISGFKGKSSDLNTLLKQALTAKNSRPIFSKNPEGFFASEISSILIKRKLIDSGHIICGFYVAGVLAKALVVIPESWHVSDYLLKAEELQDPGIIKECADACFVASVALKSPRARFYNDMGALLFFRFHEITKKEIGLYMGKNYETLMGIADECLDNLKKTPPEF